MDRELPDREDARTPGHHPVGLAPLEARIVAAVPDPSADAMPPATLRIRPMHLSQALAVWSSELPAPAWTVVVEASFDPAAGDRREIDRLVRRSEDRFGRKGSGALGADGSLDRALLLEDEEFEQLVGAAAWRSMTAIRIEGPVEASDVEAILAAIAAGRPAISGDLRAVASVRIEPGGGLEFAARSMRPIARLVAEDLACYAAAVLRCAAEEVSRPPLHQVLRLLESSGSICVRPEETDVFAESIDVGIATSAGRPADRSLIYDLPSDTWHDE